MLSANSSVNMETVAPKVRASRALWYTSLQLRHNTFQAKADSQQQQQWEYGSTIASDINATLLSAEMAWHTRIHHLLKAY